MQRSYKVSKIKLLLFILIMTVAYYESRLINIETNNVVKDTKTTNISNKYMLENQQIAKNIKLLILDVDGVLTNGKIIYDSNGNELKFFNVKDGLAIKQLQNFGIFVAIITARESSIVKKRADELGIKYLYQGQKNKLTAYQELISQLNLKPIEVAYLGDDWPDLPVLKQVGLPALVNDCEPLLKSSAKYITTKNGGKGAVREFIYFILQAQNKLELLFNV